MMRVHTVVVSPSSYDHDRDSRDEGSVGSGTDERSLGISH